MALDYVAFHLKDMVVSHYEVEIEARSGNAENEVECALTSLLDAFGETLRPWTHSKLSIGYALEDLARDLKRDGFLESGILISSAYDRIASYLSKRT